MKKNIIVTWILSLILSLFLCQTFLFLFSTPASAATSFDSSPHTEVLYKQIGEAWIPTGDGYKYIPVASCGTSNHYNTFVWCIDIYGNTYKGLFNIELYGEDDFRYF